MNAVPRVLVILASGCAATLPACAFADDAPSPWGVLNTVLQKLDLKAAPADPAPQFVTKTRPDVSGLDYMQRPVPHKVSAIPTKSPAEVQAMKDALDQARDRQLAPPPPTQLAKPQAATPGAAKTKAAKTKVSPAKPPT